MPSKTNICRKCGEVVLFDDPVPQPRKLCPQCRTVVRNPNSAPSKSNATTGKRSFGGLPLGPFPVKCRCGAKLPAEPEDFRKTRACPKCKKKVRLVGQCIGCEKPAEEVCYHWKCKTWFARGTRGGTVMESTDYQRQWAFVCPGCMRRRWVRSLVTRLLVSAAVIYAVIAVQIDKDPATLRAVAVFCGLAGLAWMAPAVWQLTRPDPEHLLVQEYVVGLHNAKLEAKRGGEVPDFYKPFPLYVTERHWEKHRKETGDTLSFMG